MAAALLLGTPVRAQPLDSGIDQRVGQDVPLDLTFHDEAGRPVSLRACCDGKPAVLVLSYFGCPRLCSVILNNLTGALRKLDYEMGRDYVVLTVSFDPREGPALAADKKSAYVSSYGRPGAERGWHFLTGAEPPIKRLADAVGFRYAFDPARNEYAHGSGIMLLTPAGKISRYFYGIDFSVRDLGFGLEDASAGHIGSPVARPLRLLCFGYDPVTGRYTVMTMRLVQLGGALTVLVIGFALGRSWRRQRRRRAALTPGR